MTDAQRAERNSDRCNELYAPLRPKVYAILRDLAGHGFRPRIQDAWRSPADQLEAFNSGHSTLRYGLHNVTTKAGRKDALALDLLDDDNALNPSKRYMLMLAASAEAHGLETGIRWLLPTPQRLAIDRAIAKKNWDAPVKIGFDPNHVQVRANRLQIAATRWGWRPKLT